MRAVWLFYMCVRFWQKAALLMSIAAYDFLIMIIEGNQVAQPHWTTEGVKILHKIVRI